MKRWIVALLVVAAVFVLIIPGLVGHLAEKDIEENVDAISDAASSIDIETEVYRRGWFRSAGIHRIEFNDRDAFPGLGHFVDSAGYASMPALVFDSEIHHGILPLGLLGEDGASIGPGVVSLVSSVSLDPGNGELVPLPGKVYTSLGLDGQSRAVIDIEPGNWSEEDTSIRWEGVDLAVSASETGQVTGIKGFVDPIALVSGKDRVESERMEIDFVETGEEYGLSIGSLKFSAGSVRISDALGSQVGFGRVELSAANDIEDGLVSGHSSIDISDIAVQGLGNMSVGMDFLFEGLDAASLGTVFSALEEAAADSDPGQAFSLLYAEHEADLQTLLGSGGTLKVERMEIGYPAGTVEMDMQIDLPETSDRSEFSWPGLLLNLKASLNLRVPEPVFDMMQSLYPDANTAVGMGFLVKDNAEYKMSLAVEQGMATVNGLPMPIPMPGQ